MRIGPALLLLASCSGEVASPSTSASGAPSVDRAQPVRGVLDHGDDPAVVAVDAGRVRCSGALVAGDAVLTARRCVSGVPPASIRVFVGDSGASAVQRARGREVVASPLIDVAVLLLDERIAELEPIAVSATGAAEGQHVRAVGFVAGDRRVRDHLVIVEASASDLAVAEAACLADPGGVALDESSGAVVGVLSRAGPSCTTADAFDVYARVDAAYATVAQGLAQSAGRAATASHAARAKKGPVDMGAGCARGMDCATGVCVSDASGDYCSRECDGRDPCPPRFRCQQGVQGERVCGRH
jgi:hypothetical protein